MTAFERFGGGERRPPHDWLAEVDPRGRAPEQRPFVYVNMVATADGRASVGGSTRALGSDADTLLLTELRALADAVLIGSGTLRAEGYGRLVREPGRVARRHAAGLDATPLAVLLSRSLDLPWDAGLFAAADQPVLVYTSAGGAPPVADPARGEGATPDEAAPPAVAAPLEVVRLPEATPEAALADLRARGVRSLLCEGGPTLNRALLAAGAVDELFLTLAPLLGGTADAPRIVEGDDLPEPLDLELAWVLRHDDELYLRYRLR
jgi:riboflavin biosynthesis pyrimidine reductase